MKFKNTEIGEPRYDYKGDYVVLDYFNVGELQLDAREHILIEDFLDIELREFSVVTKANDPTQQQLVGTLAVQSMVELKKIQFYQWIYR